MLLWCINKLIVTNKWSIKFPFVLGTRAELSWHSLPFIFETKISLICKNNNLHVWPVNKVEGIVLPMVCTFQAVNMCIGKIWGYKSLLYSKHSESNQTIERTEFFHQKESLCSIHWPRWACLYIRTTLHHGQEIILLLSWSLILLK